jgi:hypothetical protein
VFVTESAQSTGDSSAKPSIYRLGDLLAQLGGITFTPCQLNAPAAHARQRTAAQQTRGQTVGGQQPRQLRLHFFLQRSLLTGRNIYSI